MAFTLGDLPNLALLVVISAVVIGIGATVTAEMSSDLSNAAAKGTVDNGTKALENVGKKLPLIGTITALAIVLGVVFSSLAFRR